MNGLNRATVMGNLTRDVELRHTANGTPVCNLSVATGERYVDKDGNKAERTEYHEAICFGRLAELCAEYLRKGSRVYVEGPMRRNEWEKDGRTMRRTEIVAERVMFLDGKAGGSGAAARDPRPDRDG